MFGAGRSGAARRPAAVVLGTTPAASTTEGAEVLGVTRQALNNVINGKAGISPDMAIRLTKAFGSTAETWLRMQLACDLAQARKKEGRIKVRRFAPAPAEIG